MTSRCSPPIPIHGILRASVFLLAFIHPLSGAQPGAGAPARVPWVTSRLHGSPEPPPPFQAQRSFPNLQFREPVEMAHTPSQDRLFVAELNGKIFSFANRQDVKSPDLAIDISKDLKDSVPGTTQVYGLVFDPGFATNQFVYICYILKNDIPAGTRVSRFTMAGEPPRIDPASEKILITWRSGGHNGGCLQFGPDGYLYISTGDAGGPNPPDPLNTGQDNTDLLSAILRIDVHSTSNGQPYRVPADNPFLGRADCLPEIWAFGFRNPWKMSFDSKTGRLWVGDVGWELWELVFLVERGGNYGWSIVEGRQSIQPNGQRGPGPILPPVIDLPHSEAASITGGYVYYGSRLPALTGSYIFGDWATGKIWALKHDGSRVTRFQELLKTSAQIIVFGLDNAGELYFVDYAGGIYTLIPNPDNQQNSNFPRKLSETGLFSSVRDHRPAPGVIPYSVNAGQWADGASSERFLAIPNGGSIEATNQGWRFPKDSVLVRDLFLPAPTASKRQYLETQLLHFDGASWQGYSYAWDNDQSDATLVPAQGTNRTVNAALADGKTERRTWDLPARSECLRCHNPWSGSALGFNTLQLNKVIDSSTGKNQLDRLSRESVISQPVAHTKLPRLVDPSAPTAGLDTRARSYLHANCAHCHRDGAGGSVPLQVVFDLDPKKQKLIGERPAHGTFGIEDGRVVYPGEPLRSVLYYRVSTLGSGRMPHIGSHRVDLDGSRLIYDWISALPSAPAEKGAQSERSLLAALASPGDSAVKAKAIDQLLSSTSGALAAVRVLSEAGLPPELTKAIVDRALERPPGPVRDLFERFVPEERRVKKLGANASPAEILAVHGDAVRGKALFEREGAAQCQQCHRIAERGHAFGPDLSHVGLKYRKSELLDQILYPSKTIDPAFVGYQVETKDELLFTGFLVQSNQTSITLRDAVSDVEIKSDRWKSIQAQKSSLMPEGLLQALTAQDAADLVEYLAGLK